MKNIFSCLKHMQTHWDLQHQNINYTAIGAFIFGVIDNLS